MLPSLAVLALSLPLSLFAPQSSTSAPALRTHAAELSTGISVRWIELGLPEGEPVLFLHGYTDTSRSFLPTLQSLEQSRPDLRLIALDQRGHGGSSLPADEGFAAQPERAFTLDALATDALALLDHAGIRRAYVVGHSLGSAVAQELALRAPERVQGMVLIATSARFGGNPTAETFLREGLVEGPWRNALLARRLEFPRDAWRRTPLDLGVSPRWLTEKWVVEPGADPAFLEAIAEETARTPLGAWIGVLRVLEQHDNRQRLRDLRVPTLVLWPVQDVFFGEEPDQSELRDALAAAHARHGTFWAWKRYGRRPGVEGAPQTDLGHNLQWAAPDAVARDLAAFLRPDGRPTREESWLDGSATARSAARGATVITSDDGVAAIQVRQSRR